MKIRSTTARQQAQEDRAYWRSKTPEERVMHVEHLRVEAAKFLYDEPYPSRLRRVVTVTRRESR